MSAPGQQPGLLDADGLGLERRAVQFVGATISSAAPLTAPTATAPRRPSRRSQISRPSGVRRTLRDRRSNNRSPSDCFFAALVLGFSYLLASNKGLPNVLIIMAALTLINTFVTTRTTIGRRVYAMGATGWRRSCRASAPTG